MWMECGEFVSLNEGAYCVTEQAQYVFIVIGICTCQSGFLPTGSNMTCLEHHQSLCDPNPCKGGGTCEEHDGTFTCYCPPGLAGTYCQHDVSTTSMNVASFTGS